MKLTLKEKLETMTILLEFFLSPLQNSILDLADMMKIRYS